MFVKFVFNVKSPHSALLLFLVASVIFEYNNNFEYFVEFSNPSASVLSINNLLRPVEQENNKMENRGKFVFYNHGEN